MTGSREGIGWTHPRRGHARSRRDVGGAWALAGLVVLFLILLGAPREIGAQPLSIVEIESLVRALYYEGLPEERARQIGPAGAARLAEMLSDPQESRAQANILMALGLAGQPGALEAIRGWAARLPHEGEIDRDTFRAWQALPFALGHLARRDRRALAMLEAGLEAAPPGWTFRHHHGPRLHRLARRSAAMSLALTGLPEAGEVLDRALQNETDLELEAHLRSMRAMHRERAATAVPR